MKKNFGMWLFISSEILIFGVLIYLFEIKYAAFHEEFQAGSKELHFVHGTINTVILLTSSYLVALSEAKKSRMCLALAMVLGCVFLGVKGHEYYGLIHEGKFVLNFLETIPHHRRLFFTFYGFMTMLHALHVILGIMALAMVWWSMNKKPKVDYQQNVGLYWHFVDLVWVFLYPLFYLLGH
jgi:cytochrome c oxidase subunit 3